MPFCKAGDLEFQVPKNRNAKCEHLNKQNKEMNRYFDNPKGALGAKVQGAKFCLPEHAKIILKCKLSTLKHARLKR